MLSFKDYLKEEWDTSIIEVDSKLWREHVDVLNAELEKVTEKDFINSHVFMNTVRGTLERYGILLPRYLSVEQEAEIVYTLHDHTDDSRQDYTQGGEKNYDGEPDLEKFLYIVHNLSPEGHVEGYAQIVDEGALEELKHMGVSDLPTEPEVVTPQKPWIPPARRDDDSGNTDEYA